MKNSIPHLIQEIARELNLKICRSPFHAAEGLELRKQIKNANAIICVGYIFGPQQTTIYRRVESNKGLFFRNRLWFFYGCFVRKELRRVSKINRFSDGVAGESSPR